MATQSFKFLRTLGKIVDLLEIFVLCIAIVVFFPALSTAISYFLNPDPEATHKEYIESQHLSPMLTTLTSSEITLENSIEISAVNIQGRIVTSTDPGTLETAFWHKGETGTPEKGGNMVITGHRYKYLPPYTNTFYNLDKINIGDIIKITWNNQLYFYSVERIFEVNPEDVYIETKTGSHQLTLYTCTPLWTANKRLVVTAKPL